MMSQSLFVCRACGRNDFRTQRGLTQHQQSRKGCHPAVITRELFGVNSQDKEGRKKRLRGMLETTRIQYPRKSTNFGNIEWTFDEPFGGNDSFIHGGDSNDKDDDDNNNKGLEAATTNDAAADHDDVFCDFDDNSVASNDNDGSSNGVCQNNDDFGSDNDDPIDDILNNFKEYEARSPNFSVFEKSHRIAVELCRLLRQTKASLETYDLVMQWHFWANDELLDDQKVGSHPDYISREKLFRQLRARYNVDNTKWTRIKDMVLPFSKAHVRIVQNDAQAMMQSLLTDPRITDDDYCFFENDPFAPPPDNLDYIGDLNTGQSYKKTYHELIKDPSKEILLPIVFYMDGAVTGQFVGLPVTAVQFSLGIFSRVARDKEHMWRTLGYVPAYCKTASQGKAYFKQTGHADAQMSYLNRYLEDEGDFDNGDDNLDTVSAQDLHAMLEVILSGFIPLQNRGFYWDLRYKGIVYKRVKFVPFVIFFKADTEEAEKLSGSFNNHTEKVSQLCRYCECPTHDSDNHLADKYRLKTKTRIKRLYDRGELEELRLLSQQYIDNKLYPLRMGLHSDQHIHGSCPMEMLHAVLLGIFGYVRDMMFEQCGPTSQLASEFNSLASEYGERMARQSDRDMPKTKFGGGITRGKLQAKEHTGILLCMLAVLCSTKGKELLISRKKGEFAENGKIDDWIMMLEMLLQWEEWLKSPIMEKRLLSRLQYKHQYLMYIIRTVGKRKAGMGLKLVKFHAILHMRDDIVNFGVPMEYDTGCNESGHKKTKRAAKLTQKKEETFDEQVSIRLQEEHLLGLAREELRGRQPWNYLLGQFHPKPSKVIEKPPTLGGASYEAYKDNYGRNCIRLTSRGNKKEKEAVLETQLVDFLIGLNEKVSNYIGTVPMRTLHTRGEGYKFRASPCFMLEIWRDWVVVDWGKHDGGEQACKIFGFVDLTKLPADCLIEYGGSNQIGPGLYAIVQNSYKIDEDDEEEEDYLAEDDKEDLRMFVPIRTEVQELTDNMVSKLQLYLANVEAFVKPLVVIPDIGGQANDYLMLKSRQEWRELFIKYLKDSQSRYPMDDID